MTPLPPGYRTVDVPESRRADMMAVDTWAFPDAASDTDLLEQPSPLSWDRTRGVETEDGELVASHSSYPFGSFPVPGARTAVSGLTWVGVHPGHRRRGLLRSMIDDHFARSLARGEAVSALYAAEMPIYGRFGYGLAAQDLRMRIPRGAALRDVPGADAVRIRFERLDAERHGQLVTDLHGAVDRPGWATRESAGLKAAYMSDPERRRDGAESQRIALAERDGAVVGYALFRRKLAWEVPGPRGTVLVREVVAPDAAVARAIWGVLLDLDLMSTVETGMLAPDDVLTHLLVDQRGAEPRLADNVWIRLLDAPAALAARRYATAVDVVLEVRDALVPANAGRWRLVGGLEGAEVTATSDTPDIALDVRELGSVYLGGMSLAGLAAAGLVTEHRPGALVTTATAFRWPWTPVCSWVF